MIPRQQFMLDRSAAAADRVVSESEVPASRNVHLPHERVVKPKDLDLIEMGMKKMEVKRLFRAASEYM